MNSSLFKELKAYFSEKTPTFIVKLWQIYGGKVIFIPDYEKPDIWFGFDKFLIKKKNALHERWIYDSILLNKCLPYEDYYAMNQSRLIKFKSFYSNKRMKKDNKMIDCLTDTPQKNSDISYIYNTSKVTPIQSISLNNSLSPERNIYSSSNKNYDSLSTLNQKIETPVFDDKSLSHDSLFSHTKSSSYTSSSETFNSPIERIKIIALEDLESAVDIFEVITVQKIHNQDGILFLKLK